MRKSLATIARAAAFLLVVGGPAGAQQTPCVGDCDNTGAVTINEIITCVNIGLDLLQLSSCDKCDTDGDGQVSISEIITGVNQGLDLLHCSPPAECGDGIVDPGEDCDDGNNFGGDGCAKNCTNETRRAGDFDPNKATSLVQTAVIPIHLFLSGSQALITGRPRDTAVVDPQGRVVTKPGEVPVVIKAADVEFHPVSIPGIDCACVRGIAVPDLFGPGNAGDGVIGCGENGLTDIDYNLMQDHNTTPGSPGNLGGLPDDPECNAKFTFPSGAVSMACLEGSGEKCSTPDFEHIGVCNSPRVIEFSGGQAPRGSALINNNTSISLLKDNGMCAETRKSDGSCNFSDYGPDCLPCTADDAVFLPAENIPTTTGTAQGTMFDANTDPKNPQDITKDEVCGGGLCQTTITGSLFDCDKLNDPDPNAALAGSALAACFPTIDAAEIADNVNCSLLVTKQ